MCAQFEQKIERIQDWPAAFEAFRSILEIVGPVSRMLPYQPAAVVTREGPSQKQFSLVPRWAKEAKLKYATHNARLDTINEKASFKDAFIRRHCIVPMTGFLEASYDGPLEGHMLQFMPNAGPLLAVGIWEECKLPKGEIIDSFSVITHDPLHFVMANGHDRSPVFLDAKNAQIWLNNENADLHALKEFLRKESFTPDLKVEIDRAMAKGWEKRKKKSV